MPPSCSLRTVSKRLRLACSESSRREHHPLPMRKPSVGFRSSSSRALFCSMPLLLLVLLLHLFLKLRFFSERAAS